MAFHPKQQNQMCCQASQIYFLHTASIRTVWKIQDHFKDISVFTSFLKGESKTEVRC